MQWNWLLLLKTIKIIQIKDDVELEFFQNMAMTI
jgi:hypothetical protein